MPGSPALHQGSQGSLSEQSTKPRYPTSRPFPEGPVPGSALPQRLPTAAPEPSCSAQRARGTSAQKLQPATPPHAVRVCCPRAASIPLLSCLRLLLTLKALG